MFKSKYVVDDYQIGSALLIVRPVKSKTLPDVFFPLSEHQVRSIENGRYLIVKKPVTCDGAITLYDFMDIHTNKPPAEKKTEVTDSADHPTT
jgi:hypothetical protein